MHEVLYPTTPARAIYIEFPMLAPMFDNSLPAAIVWPGHESMLARAIVDAVKNRAGIGIETQRYMVAAIERFFIGQAPELEGAFVGTLFGTRPPSQEPPSFREVVALLRDARSILEP